MTARAAEIQLAPLVRSEAMWLLGGVQHGSLVCAVDGRTVPRPAVHTVVAGELIVRVPLGADLDHLLSDGVGCTYRAEDVDPRSLAGWYATVTGTALLIDDPHEHDHYSRTLAALTGVQTNRLLRLRPRLVAGHRIQRVTAATG